MEETDSSSLPSMMQREPGEEGPGNNGLMLWEIFLSKFQTPEYKHTRGAKELFQLELIAFLYSQFTA